MKKLISYSNDVDEILEALEKEGAFEEEDGAKEEIKETEKK